MVTTAAREENGEFCIAVAHATRTAGILTQLVKGAVKLSRPSSHIQKIIISGTERNGGTHCDWLVDGIGHR